MNRTLSGGVEKPSAPMMRIARPVNWRTFLIAVLARVVAALVGVGIGGAVGFLIGAEYGGNVATDFELGGARGYEATGPIGALVGAAAMGVAGYAGVARLTSRWTRTT